MGNNMNEKIKELIEQTGLAIDIFGNPIWGNVGTPIAQKQFLEKFAESIIKETIKIIQATAAESVDLDRTLVENVSWTVNDIKKHFGVE
jgi:hypothetical protein